MFSNEAISWQKIADIKRYLKAVKTRKANNDSLVANMLHLTLHLCFPTKER